MHASFCWGVVPLHSEGHRERLRHCWPALGRGTNATMDIGEPPILSLRLSCAMQARSFAVFTYIYRTNWVAGLDQKVTMPFNTKKKKTMCISVFAM